MVVSIIGKLFLHGRTRAGDCPHTRWLGMGSKGPIPTGVDTPFHSYRGSCRVSPRTQGVRVGFVSGPRSLFPVILDGARAYPNTLLSQVSPKIFGGSSWVLRQ